MAEAGLMPQRPWHSRQSDGEVMDGADDCDEQKGFWLCRSVAEVLMFGFSL